MSRDLLTITLLTSLALAPRIAAAERLPTTREITSVRAAGMGDAVRGFASGNEALMANPAGIAGTIRFNAEAMAIFEPAFDYRVLGVASVDSKINAEQSFALSGGAGYYNYTSGEGAEARKGSITAAGFALPLYPETVFIGTTAKWFKLTGAAETGATTNAVTLDAGVLVRLFSLLNLGAVGYNLVNVYSPEAQRGWGFGAAVGSGGTFNLDFDLRLDTDAAGAWARSYHAGGEYLIGGLVMPRVGYVHDGLRGVKKLTGGVSIILGTLAVELAYQHALDGKGRYFGIGARLLDSPG